MQEVLSAVEEVLSYGKFRSFEKILAQALGHSNRRQFP
jgi:hypothetical protein